MPARIDLIDDDPALREFIGDYLQSVGFEVRRFDGVAAFRIGAKKSLPDVVVSDLLMPDEDGLALLAWLRGFSQVPVIMLTSQDETADRVVGLELGADDYIAKPCEPRELLAVIRTQLRRSRSASAPATDTAKGPDVSDDAPRRWSFGSDHVLDERALELRVRGERVELARKPLELLMVFLRHPGEVLDKERLLEAVWPGRIVSDTALTNAIGKLRTALGDDEQRMLKAVYGYGYRFELTPRSETV